MIYKMMMKKRISRISKTVSELYQKGMRREDIAEELEITIHLVRRMLKETGTEIRVSGPLPRFSEKERLIIRRRHKIGRVTQAALAKELGVSRGTIGRIVNDKYTTRKEEYELAGKYRREEMDAKEWEMMISEELKEKLPLPKRIAVHRVERDGSLGAKEHYKAHEINDRWGDTEYVRVDVVLGDTNEPLKSGQFRWVRHKSTPGILDVARVSVEYDGMWMNETSGNAYRPDQYSYIGPVVMPTEEIENA